jgi:hypothetical protein
LRIYYLKQVTSVEEPMVEAVNLVITTQVLLHYTIMAATFPCLKPFLSAFEPELWEASYVGPSTLFRSRQTRDHKGYLLHSVEKEQNSSTSAQISSLGETHRKDVERSPPASVDATVSGTMIIRKTQEWRVTHEMKP